MRALITRTLGSDDWVTNLDMLQVRLQLPVVTQPPQTTLQTHLHALCRFEEPRAQKEIDSLKQSEENACPPMPMSKVITPCHAMQSLREKADDPEFQRQWQQVKAKAKAAAMAKISAVTGVRLPADSMLDVQVGLFSF